MTGARPTSSSDDTLFARWQMVYAEHHIATVPLNGKVPAVKHPQRFGLRGSAELARKPRFAGANIGFYAGARSRITVLDIDARDERILVDALDRHGSTPIITRTASGKWHGWFRHNGERRRIRPWGDDIPIDIIGAGLAVAPPSHIDAGRYEFVQGSLDDLHQLPTMRGLDGLEQPKAERKQIQQHDRIPEGRRNVSLWQHCMRQARQCQTFDELLEAAREANTVNHPALTDAEVANTAASAWSYTQNGLNRFGQHGAFVKATEMMMLIGEASALHLLAFLRVHNGLWSTFLCCNTLAELFGWTPKRLAAARSKLIDLGFIRCIRRAGRGHAALFEFVE